MKLCMLCGQEKEEVSTLVVPPATWNQFNNFATVCAECAAATKNRTRLRLSPKKGLAQADAPEGPHITISHRRSGAILKQVPGTTLQNADLSNIALNGADLQHVSLNGANLAKTDLRLADLQGADLRNADLRGTNFRSADLRDADLRGARLDGADLRDARCSGGTQWPDGYDARRAGAQIG